MTPIVSMLGWVVLPSVTSCDTRESHSWWHSVFLKSIQIRFLQHLLFYIYI